MSTAPLFLLDALPADGVADIELRGEEGHHAARVRRLGVGEAVVLGDGRGTRLACSVEEVLPDGLRLAVLERTAEAAPEPRLVVVQALPKGDRAERAVEVLTELGVDEIVPWSALRCVVQWSGSRGARAHAKWVATAREAAKQSRRSWLPVVAPLATTAAVATRLAAGTGLVLHESAASPLVAAPVPDAGEVVVVVGPEGGITAGELDVFAAAGANAVRLGTPVLRTSTAGAAALAVLSARSGRWN
jgi:16S rRNA (uracil1498-N3)-methyltransferase